LGLTEFETILSAAIKNLEKLTGVKITKQKIDKAMKEAIHISIHELAHMYLEQALPWLSSL
jgi:benzoyl-CoA reductase/2-hydroxyglutaryl-CoA dehydratase subunit BcrC/BadD/HgdB